MVLLGVDDDVAAAEGELDARCPRLVEERAGRRVHADRTNRQARRRQTGDAQASAPLNWHACAQQSAQASAGTPPTTRRRRAQRGRDPSLLLASGRQQHGQILTRLSHEAEDRRWRQVGTHP